MGFGFTPPTQAQINAIVARLTGRGGTDKKRLPAVGDALTGPRVGPDALVLVGPRGQEQTVTLAEAVAGTNFPTSRAVGRPAPTVPVFFTLADRSGRVTPGGVLVSSAGKPLPAGSVGRTKTAEDFFGRPSRITEPASGVAQGLAGGKPESPKAGAAQGAVIGGRTAGAPGAAIGAFIGAIAGALRGGERVIRYPVEVIQAAQKQGAGLRLTQREQAILNSVRDQGLTLDPATLQLVPDPAVTRRAQLPARAPLGRPLPTVGARGGRVAEFGRGGAVGITSPTAALPKHFGLAQARAVQAGVQLEEERDRARILQELERRNILRRRRGRA